MRDNGRCKICQFKCYVNRDRYFLTERRRAESREIKHLSPALAQKYSRKCLGVRNSKTSLYMTFVISNGFNQHFVPPCSC